MVYNRTKEDKKLVDFSEAVTRKVTQRQLLDTAVLLTSTNMLMYSEPITNTSLTTYVIAQSFELVLTYTEPSDFTNITLSTSNYYSSTNTDLPVEFQHDDEEGKGVRWYTVMIIALLVVIICGVAYGMYLKMIKKRKDKTVSLLTEGEELDEQV